MKKIFILGMGAQKAGTTWMHDYLSKFKEVNFGFKKEYHVLDFQIKPFRKMGIRKFLSLSNFTKYRQQLIDIKKDDIDINLLGNLMTTSMIMHPDLYYAYFNFLLCNDKFITGDFSPENAGIEKENLIELRDNFKIHSIEVIPIFLMRDPLERVRSNISMTIASKAGDLLNNDEVEKIQNAQKTGRERIKSDYLKTLKNIKEVFGDRSFISFYEQIFTESEIKRLTSLLGLKYEKPNFKRFSNKAKRSKADISDDRKKIIIKNYKHTYHGLYDIYGKDFMDSIWNSSKLID